MSQQLPADIEKAEVEISARPGFFRLFLTAMRPHQWVKNLFIFAPILFGMKMTDPGALVNAILAFVVFCLLASSLYIFNDWTDIEDDRNHPEKCKRPLSSGQLAVSSALGGAAVLAIAAFAISAAISLNFTLIAALYFILTLSYCLALKRMVVLDAMTIAAGFVIRIIGGAVAVSVAPSHWLIVCAYLLALFLAFSKRRQELLSLSDMAGEHREVLNHYSVEYLGHVNSILIAASIVCYALYAVAPETVARFKTDNLIYGTVFVIYGMLRYMALIQDPSNGGNPSKMLLSDKPLFLTVIAWGMYNAAVIYQLQISEYLFGAISG